MEFGQGELFGAKKKRKRRDLVLLMCVATGDEERDTDRGVMEY